MTSQMLTFFKKDIQDTVVLMETKFNQRLREMQDFTNNRLNLYHAMKKNIEEDLEKQKTSYKKEKKKVQKKEPIVPPENLIENKVESRLTRSRMMTVLNNVQEYVFMQQNDSISTRTRSAMKAVRESKLSVLNSTYNVKGTRARSSRTTDNESVTHKRSAEQIEESVHFNSKRIKQEKLSIIEQSHALNETFKKPNNRGKKPKKAKDKVSLKKSDSNISVNESAFFNNPIHQSSPNVNSSSQPSDTVILSPKISNITDNSLKQKPIEGVGTPSVKEKVAVFERLGFESGSASKRSTAKKISGCNGNKNGDYSKNSGENSLAVNVTKDHISAPNTTKECTKVEVCVDKPVTRTSAKITKSTTSPVCVRKSIHGNEKYDQCNSTKVISSDVGAQNNEAIGNVQKLEGSEEKNSEELDRSEEYHSLPEESTLSDFEKETKVDSDSAARSEKPGKDDIECRSGNSEVKTDIEGGCSNIMATSVSPKDGDLNVTKLITASKRTKPVVKSKFFDNGKYITENNEVNVPEATDDPSAKLRTRTLRSSNKDKSQKLCAVVKGEIVTPPINACDSISVKPSRTPHLSRGSNEENEPQNNRKKKTKVKNEENLILPVEVTEDTGRITRTKTKKAREAAQEANVTQSGLSLMARKSLYKAKKIVRHNEKLKALQVLALRATPQNIPNVHTQKVISASKNIVNSSSCTKLKKPLSVISNSLALNSQIKTSTILNLKTCENLSAMKNKYLLSNSKERDGPYITPAKSGILVDGVVRVKNIEEDDLEKELKLKTLKEREEEALLKREIAIKNRQNELKRKNDLKLQSAMKQRKKLEEEKHNNIIQTEKEKELKRKMLLEERKNTMKERALMKKIKTEKKLAETEERRKQEELARLARLKELEAEQQRINMEKQKELERQEKRAQERLAEQKAKEKYELQLKQEEMREKLAAQKAAQMQNANKSTKPEANHKSKWNYKSRNDNDYGLEDENSEYDSDCDEQTNDRPRPLWAQRVRAMQNSLIKYGTENILMSYISCGSKTPDIHRMFNMTPNKRIKRTSSAIWNTPSS